MVTAPSVYQQRRLSPRLKSELWFELKRTTRGKVEDKYPSYTFPYLPISFTLPFIYTFVFLRLLYICFRRVCGRYWLFHKRIAFERAWKSQKRKTLLLPHQRIPSALHIRNLSWIRTRAHGPQTGEHTLLCLEGFS